MFKSESFAVQERHLAFWVEIIISPRLPQYLSIVVITNYGSYHLLTFPEKIYCKNYLPALIVFQGNFLTTRLLSTIAIKFNIIFTKYSKKYLFHHKIIYDFFVFTSTIWLNCSLCIYHVTRNNSYIIQLAKPGRLVLLYNTKNGQKVGDSSSLLP